MEEPLVTSSPETTDDEQLDVADGSLREINNPKKKAHSIIWNFIWSRGVRKATWWLSQAATSLFVLFTKFGLTHVMKYFIASAQIPIELFMLATQLKTMHQKKSSWVAIVAMLALGLVPIFFYIMYDIYNWGSSNPFVAAAVNALPPVFAALMAVVAVINTIRFIDAIIKHRRNPIPMTPLTNIRLANKGIKAIAALIIAALIVPASMFPPLMIPFFCVMALGFTAIVVTKIVKHFFQLHQWKKAIASCDDPYQELLGSEVQAFHDALARDEAEKGSVKALEKIKNIFRGNDERQSMIILKAALRYKVSTASDLNKKEYYKNIYDLLKSKHGRHKYEKSLLPPEELGYWGKKWAGFKLKVSIKFGSKKVAEEPFTYKPVLVSSSSSDDDNGDPWGFNSSGNVFHGVGGVESKMSHEPTWSSASRITATK